MNTPRFLRMAAAAGSALVVSAGLLLANVAFAQSAPAKAADIKADATKSANIDTVTVEGFDFPVAAQVGGQRLALNGAGGSNILSVKATAVALYLPSKATTPEAAFVMPGAKRITLVALRELSARDLSSALIDRIRQNATQQEIESNVMQLAGLGGVFGTRRSLPKGSVVTIDYNPATKSTEFRLNGTERLAEPIVGDSFFPMMMKVWLGPRIRPATRNALLGIAS
jgi:hypothetical protein